MKSKKGLSEMMGYVILVLIGISLATGVYLWLKDLIPNLNKLECSDDVSLIVREYSCDTVNKKINITFQNKGLFNVVGAYILLANESGKIPTYGLNVVDEDPPLREAGVVYFNYETDLVLKTSGPESTESIDFDYSSFNDIKRVSLLPFVIKKQGNEDKVVICSKSKIIQDISC